MSSSDEEDVMEEEQFEIMFDEGPMGMKFHLDGIQGAFIITAVVDGGAAESKGVTNMFEATCVRITS